MIAAGRAADRDACIRLWLDAVAERDGRPAPTGTAERCAAKFARATVSFLVARDGARDDDGDVTGFALVTEPGSGAATDPPDAAYLAMLAVAPGAQGAGLGAQLLDAATGDARAAGHTALVLHVLASNAAAVRLYASRGWAQRGPGHAHPLSGELSQTVTVAL
ncbi:hypothetical protein GCM10027406_08010 [Leifsonia lichenia]